MRDVIDDAPTTLQTAATATGNGTALDVKGYAAVAVQVTGTFSATVTAEVTLDGTNWVSTEGMKIADGSKSATATATGIYVFPLLGAERFRLRVSAYTSGSVTAVARGITGAAGAYSPDVQLSAGVIDIGTVDQGTGGASAWLVNTELGAAAPLTAAVTSPNGPVVGAVPMVSRDGTDAWPQSAGSNVTDGADGRTHAATVAGEFNGSNYDRRRNNSDVTVLASAARTTAANSSDQTNYNGRAAHFVIDVTAVAGSPSLTVTIQGKDAVSGKYYTILASAAITGTGTTVLRVGPGIAVAANAAAADILPRTWRVSVGVGTADSVTYSVGASVIV